MSAQTKVRCVTFNICGIKGILSRCAQWLPEKSFNAMFNTLEGDILCFQETKIQSGDITREMSIVPGFNAYFTCSTGKKGYSGVSFYVRDNIRVYYAEEGLTGWLTTSPNGKPYRECDHFPNEIYPEAIGPQAGKLIDEQGRVLTMDIGACVVIGTYCPANSQGNMQEYRDTFFDLLDWRIHKLRDAGREVIIMGDLNVARQPRDSAPLRSELLKENLKIDEQEWMYGSVARTAVNTWIDKDGFKDTVRDFHPNRDSMFTCWDQSRNCRAGNFGSRIDYVLASSGIGCIGANILPGLVGSDHCPAYADLQLENITSQGTHPLPLLAKNLKNRWPLQIQSFFFKTSESPPLPKPDPRVSMTKDSDNKQNAGYHAPKPVLRGKVQKQTITSKQIKQKTVADMFGQLKNRSHIPKHQEP